MPSTSRRRFLAAVGAAGSAAVAGCSAVTDGAADVDPATGLDGDPSDVLDDRAVYLAGDADDLPEPPSTTDSLSDAEVVLATPDAPRSDLVAGLRNGATVAVAGSDSARPVAGALAATGEHAHGVESVHGRPVAATVAAPSEDTATTVTALDRGGWSDPVLDAVGWAERARVPECRTFVPESSADDEYEYAGQSFVAGRLDTGETFASRTAASVRDFDGDHLARLRTTMHAAANDGYAVDEARRVVDLPNDQSVHDMFPNPHERNGVEVHNQSSPIEETLDVRFAATTDRARGSLTGCCGLTTDGDLAYDHRVRWTWTDDRLLGSDTRYAGGIGRGEWVLDV